MAGERPLNVGDDFQMSADLYNNLIRGQQQRGGKPPQRTPPPRQYDWVDARNQYKTTGGDEVDLMPGEGVWLNGPHVGNDPENRGLLFPPDPEKPDKVAAFNDRPVMQIFRQPAGSPVAGIVMDPIPYGAVGRVLLSGVHVCQVTGPRSSTNRWATPGTSNKGPLTVGPSGEFQLIAQWWPESAGENEPRPALVLAGRYGYVPQFNSEIRLQIWGPPTGGTWGMTWNLPAVTVDDVDYEAFTVTLTNLAFDISAADLEQKIIDAAGGKIGPDDFDITGSMLNGFLLYASDEGNFRVRYIKLPTVDLTGLEAVILGSHCSYDQTGLLVTGY